MAFVGLLDGDYLLAFFPLALQHLIVPPLSYLQGLEDPPEGLASLFDILYRLAPPALLNRKYVNSLALPLPSKQDASKPLSQIISSQHLTYMFVHGTYNHLIGNLVGAFIWGRKVFKELGVDHMYTLYILGGVASALPSSLYDRSTGSVSLLGSEAVQRLSDAFSVPQHIVKPVDNVVRKAGDLLSSLFQTVTIGSSGAVSALMGCSAMLAVRRMYLDVLDLLEEFQQSRRRGFKSSYSPSDSRILSFAISTAMNGFQIVQSLNFFREELFLSDPRNVITRDDTYWNTAWRMFQVSGTNHVAHCQGFIVGAAYGFAFGIVWPAWIRGRSRGGMRF